MWVNHVILALMGLFAGFAVSAGTFAFLIAIGVIPRLIGKSNTARAVFSYETMILLGGVVGNIISTYSDMSMPAGRILSDWHGHWHLWHLEKWRVHCSIFGQGI